MSGSQIMIVLIVSIVMIASVLRARYGAAKHLKRNGEDPDAARLRDEVRALKDRVQVLERIATDRNHLLEQQIDALRER